MFKTMKFKAATVLFAAIALVTAGGISPAAAAETTWGAISCVQGTAYTKAKTSGYTMHYLWYNGSMRSKFFSNPTWNPVVKTWYSGLYSSTHGGVHTPATLAWGYGNCAD